MKNKAKSLFISFFITALCITELITLYYFATKGVSLNWLGTFLSTTGMLGFFVKIYIFPTARTTAYMVPLFLFIISGAFVSIAGYIFSLAFIHAPIYSLSILFCSFIYIFWYSKLDREQPPVIIKGEPLPAFSLKRPDGASISSEELLGKKTLYIFYRGNWCPFCMAQIREIASHYQELAARDIQIVFVSPQPESQTEKLAKVFEIPAHFLVDEDGEAAKALHIYAENGLPAGLEMMGYDSDTVYPTTIITNESGEVVYCDLTDNYRVRPHPEDYIGMIDEYEQGLATA